MAYPITAHPTVVEQLRITSELFDLCIKLDDLDAHASQNFINGKLDDKVQTFFTKKIAEIALARNGIEASFTKTYEEQLPYLRHVSGKLESLKNKYSLASDPANSMRNVPHPQFTNNATPPQKIASRPIEQSHALAKRNVSFNITTPSEQDLVKPAAPSISTLLSRISFLLKNARENEALKEFENLPGEVKQSLFGALWIVRGKPMPGNPIAHDNFGEVSFFNKEQRCASTPQQKACAIELIKIEQNINEMISLLKQNKTEEAKKIFLTLPEQLQGYVFGKHWEICGKPTQQSPTETLKKMAHNDFGKVSFLGTESRCDVPASKKIETLSACLPHFIQSSTQAQELVQPEIAAWKGIDESRAIPGQEKNSKKNESIHAFSAKIIRLFLGVNAKIEIPNLGNNKNGQAISNYKAVAAAYIEKYPFLKPFLLQLENSIALSNEKLEDLPSSAETPKSSEKFTPDFRTMTREAFNVQIMNETLETLNKGYYINSKGKKVLLNLEPSIQSLEMIPSGHLRRRADKYDTKLILQDTDCLTATLECIKEGLNPIVLDAASNGHFGGGYKSGASAQEEHLCRVSGLSIAVDPAQGKQKKNFYPLNTGAGGDAGGLYVSNVPVFRGEQKDGFPYLDEPFETAVAIMAAFNFNHDHQTKNGVQNPPKADIVNGKHRIPDAYIELTKAKIRTTLYMAEKHGHDAVVLVALGCGAFCTPPDHMSELMMDVITNEFPHSFKEIRFTIMNDHNTGKDHNPDGNYTPFKKTIESLAGNLGKMGMTFEIR